MGLFRTKGEKYFGMQRLCQDEDPFFAMLEFQTPGLLVGWLSGAVEVFFVSKSICETSKIVRVDCVHGDAKRIMSQE
jgi:hypothetical protein